MRSQGFRRGPRRERPLTEDALTRSALWHLARRALTREQLRALLERKAARAAAVHGPQPAAPAWIAAVLQKLQDSLLLDDAHVARARAQSGRAAGRSRRALLARLARQGVDDETANAALRSIDDEAGDDPELAAAIVWARKKGLKKKEPSKALASLARQGFSSYVARRALAALAGDAEGV